MQLPNFGNLPPWAIPIGLGGAAGLVVLARRGHGTTTPQPIPITGQDGGTTSVNADAFTAALTGINKTLSDALAGISAIETQTGQDIITSQGHTLDTITALLAAQATQEQQSLGAMQTMYQSSFGGITDILNSMMQLIQHPPTTGISSIIDKLKQQFANAFDAIAAPPGQAQQGTDIITGTLPNAPYAQDTGFTYYGTTQHYVTGPFRRFFGTTGGARTWGYPLSQVFSDHGVDTQVFERVILKYVPGSNPANNDIIVVPVLT